LAPSAFIFLHRRLGPAAKAGAGEQGSSADLRAASERSERKEGKRQGC
jgi:hypothetical protein